jgi:hypothetical protein
MLLKTYAWSGFRIVCLGEKSAAQSVEQPDFQNAAARYNRDRHFSVFCYATREKRISKGRNVGGVWCFRLGKR